MEHIINLARSLGCRFVVDEPMCNHTTFKIGGKAKLMVFPQNEEQIVSFVKETKKQNIRLVVVGNGSNLLVSDDGIDGVVMVLGKDFAKISVNGDVIFAQSGAMLSAVCKTALDNSLSLLEFAYGIPGTVGGAAFMNAGAYGSEMKDVLIKCTHIDANGNMGELCGDDLNLSYRHSAYYDNGAIITGVYLQLKNDYKQQIKSKMDELLMRRKDKQPLEYPSAGSTFKRPMGYFAGALIEQCGLKGKSVGGAEISTKHAGFVINKGGASCSDVLNLCKYCSETVLKEKGVELEMEIRVTK